MTNEEAAKLRPGDPVWAGVYFPGTTPQVKRLAYVAPTSGTFHRSPCHDLSDGAAYPQDRIHLTEVQAQAGVADLLEKQIVKHERLLAEWGAATGVRPGGASEAAGAVELLLVAEVTPAYDEEDAAALLDDFREAVHPGSNFGITLRRAAPRDARRFDASAPLPFVPALLPAPSGVGR